MTLATDSPPRFLQLSTVAIGGIVLVELIVGLGLGLLHFLPSWFGLNSREMPPILTYTFFLPAATHVWFAMALASRSNWAKFAFLATILSWPILFLLPAFLP
jgi:hypothetical protein